jgi:hypothetical protein
MKKAPIRTWREPIDQEMVAVIARVDFISHGWYHGAGCFIILHKHDGLWEEKAAQRFRQFIAEKHHGHIPFLWPVRDHAGNRP